MYLPNTKLKKKINCISKIEHYFLRYFVLKNNINEVPFLKIIILLFLLLKLFLFII